MGSKSGKQRAPKPTPSTQAQPKQHYDLEFKVLFIGDAGVGKSNLLLRIADNTFSDSFISTIGADYKVTYLIIAGQVIKLQIWDTAGQERFRTITSSYYRGAHCVLCVYDVLDKQSFTNMNKWISEVERYACDTIVRAFIGNKIDEPSQRIVGPDEAQRYAEEHKVPHFEVSAKSGEGIEYLTTTIAEMLLDKVSE